MSPQQQRMWGELTQLRAQIEYLQLYEWRYERIDRALKMFLAVAASGSIAAWAIWRQYQMVWAAVIAASQVLNAVKAYLPFEGRRRAAAELAGKLEALFVQWETSFNHAAGGKISETEINDRISELKRAKVELVGSCLEASSLPRRRALEAEAASSAAAYFEIMYPTGANNEQENEEAQPTTKGSAGTA